MRIDFSKGNWNPADFTQVRSLRNTNGWAKFIQMEDCIVNDERALERGSNDYEYISLLYKDEYTSGVTVEAECAFREFGAPLLVFTDDVKDQPDGVAIYGHHFEVVAFEEGFNIWELNGKDKPILAAKGRFPVPAGEKIVLSATIRPEQEEVEVTLNGVTARASVPHMPEKFRVGFTACEGENRFYYLAIR